VCSAADCTPLLIQQNDGSGSMNRSWAEYKVGFREVRGNWRELSGNYWLGNDLLHQATTNPCHNLRFELQSRHNDNWYYADYSRFRVLSEADNYAVLVGGASGNASSDAGWDTFYLGRSSVNFSTSDRDNSGSRFYQPAAEFGGGWWYPPGGAGCNVNGARSGHFYWMRLPGGGNLQRTRIWLKCKGSP